jgi:hypothetical protein
MSFTPADPSRAVRGHRTVVVVQLVLTLVAIIVSRLGLEARTAMVLILAAATGSAGMVVFSSFGLRHQWRPVYVVLGIVAVVCANLLFWTGWQEYDRVRFP